jgi:hypothetical protein
VGLFQQKEFVLPLSVLWVAPNALQLRFVLRAIQQLIEYPAQSTTVVLVFLDYMKALV